MATGENTGAWGDVTNTNLSAVEEAVARSTNVAFAGTANIAVAITDFGAPPQAGRSFRLNLTGTGTVGQTLTVPDIEKGYIVNNGLSVAVNVKNSTSTPTTQVAAGKSTYVYSKGSTGVVPAFDGVSALGVINTLDVGGNASVKGTFNLGGSASIASTLYVTGDQHNSAELTVRGAISGASTLTIGNTISGAGTLNIKGSASIASTLSVTGAQYNSSTFTIRGAISGASTLNISSDIISQTNVSSKGTLGVGASATFAGAISANSTLNITGAVSSNSTLTTTGAISDGDGNLRDVPQARVVSATADLVTTDLGNFVLNTLKDNKLTVPTGDFGTGQIISVVNRASAATIVNSVGTTGFIIAGAAASTSTATLGNNGVCSILFIGQNSAYLTGNVS